MIADESEPPTRPFELLIEGLQVPFAWPVGPVTFRPAGALLADLEIGNAHPEHWYQGWLREHLVKWTFATAQTMAKDQVEAEAVVSASLAVLRLFQGTRTRLDTRNQLFGLPGELMSARRESVALGDFPGLGWRNVGSLGPWTFSDEDARAFANDARFSYLVNALLLTPSQRNELQDRALLSLELLDEALLTSNRRMSVLLSAIAIEILLGDERRADRVVRIAARGAFLSCHGNCGRGGGDCPYTVAATWRDVEQINANVPGICSAFMKTISGIGIVTTRRDPRDGSHIGEPSYRYGLFEDRNKIVHAGAAPDDDASKRHAWNATHLYLKAIEWVATNSAATVDDIDAGAVRARVESP